MVVESVLNCEINVDSPTELPFFERLKNAKRFVYHCKKYTQGVGADIAMIWEETESPIWKYVYRTGLITIDDEALVGQILRKVDDIAPDSDELNTMLIQTVRSNLPPPESIRQAYLSAEPLIDRLIPQKRTMLESQLSVVRRINVKGIRDSICRTRERTVAFDGANTFDLRWWYELSSFRELMQSVADLFEVH
jgi:hypothetical protein